jgi:hypothetical protein
MMDLKRLPQVDARRLLALAGVALAAKHQHEPREEWISIEGPAISDEAVRDAAHRILVEKRRALGITPVDLSLLMEGGRAPNSQV